MSYFCNVFSVLNKSKVIEIINIPRLILYNSCISEQIHMQTDPSSGLVFFGLFDLGV